MANLELTRKNMEDNGFKTLYFETGAEAAQYVSSTVDGATVGFGGTMTARDIGLYEMLTPHNKTIWHWKGDDHKEAVFCDVYITSANAIAETGEIFNLDGNCNRVATAMYGHKKVIYLVSVNKITADFDSALFRTRHVAGPLRAQSMGRKTPCAEKADKCYNCKSPERICRGLSVMLYPSSSVGETEIIFIGEKLGL